MWLHKQDCGLEGPACLQLGLMLGCDACVQKKTMCACTASAVSQVLPHLTLLLHVLMCTMQGVPSVGGFLGGFMLGLRM